MIHKFEQPDKMLRIYGRLKITAAMARTMLETNAHLAAARIAATGVNDPNDVQTLLGQGKQLADGVAVGTLDPTKLTKQQKNTLNIYQQATGDMIPNSSKYTDQVKQLPRFTADY